MDKTQWGAGPWQSEPDLVRWTYRGVPCLIVRSPHAGTLCGYVAVRRGHPLYLRHYDHCRLDCHGGLTFSGRLDLPPPVNTRPLQGLLERALRPSGEWWLGFDCAHAGDYMPAIAARTAVYYETFPELAERLFGRPRGEIYRDIEFVTADVEAMARAVARMPVGRFRRRDERKFINRVRRKTRAQLVKLAGQPLVVPWWPLDMFESGLRWQGVHARSALCRCEQYPGRAVKVPRSLRGYL